MEGMPRFPMFAPDFKLGCNSLEENGLPDKLFKYIKSHYKQDPKPFFDDIEELNKIRNICLLPYPSEDLIPYMKRYYAQLLLLSNQFPLDGKHPDMTCEWQWSDRVHDPNNVLIIHDVHFELCNLMYNLAAIHAQIGAEIPRENDEGIKKAFTHFGYAAYPLQLLRDEMNAARFPTLDFDKDTLSLYLNIIMGQAQECMVEKALVESRKPMVIARLSAHLFDIYKRCAEHLVNGPLGDMMNSSRYKEWVRMCVIKSTVYGAITMLYQGIEAEENKRYGERVAFYDEAHKFMVAAREHCAKETRRPYLETVAFVDDVVAFKMQDARKENDFIYHMKIPKPEEIQMLEPLAMACAYSFNPLDPETAGPPLFAGLIPPAVIKAASRYEERKAEMKRGIMEKVEAYDVELMQFLDRIDLAKLLKMIRNPYGKGPTEDLHLPEELLAANSYFSVQNREAVPEVLEQLRVIGEKARETDTLLSQLIVRLDALEGEGVPHADNAEGVRAIKTECVKLLEASASAKGRNMKIRLALDERMEAIQTLGLGLEELVRMIGPKGEEEERKDYASSPEGARLLQLGEKVEEMKRQRKSLLEKMHEELQKDNINSLLLIEKDTDNKDLFEKELKKHDNIVNLLEQNLSAQQRILNALLEANADFAGSGNELRRQAEERNMKMMDLIASSDEYFRVIAELEQGESFYNRLEERTRKIATTVDTIENSFSDFFKRRNEKMASDERKKAEERAALDARAAMEDFSMSSFPSLSSLPGVAAGAAPAASPLRPAARNDAGGRRRLGDYMQYYRDKMSGGGGAAPPSPSSPYAPSAPPPAPASSYLQFSHAPVQPGPPLPPLSIPSAAMQLPQHYAESSGAPSPAPSTVSNMSYAPPPAAAAAAVAPYQGFPRFPPGGGSGGMYVPQQQQMPSHAPYAPPPQLQQQHGFPTATAAGSAHSIHAAAAQQPQPQPPAAAYGQYMQQQPQAPPTLSAPYIPPQQSSPQPQQTFQPAPPTVPVQAPPTPQPTVPQTAPAVPPTVSSAAGFVPPPPTSFASRYAPPPVQPGVYGAFPPTIPAASPFAAPVAASNSPWLQGPNAAAAAARPFAAPTPPVQLPQQPPALQQQQPSSMQPPVSQPTTPAAPAAASKLPSLADLGAQLRAAAATPPVQPMQQPPPPAAATLGGPSPWHRGLNAGYGMPNQPLPQSPWMQQQPIQPAAGFGAAAPAAAQPPAIMQPTQQQQYQQPAAPMQPYQQQQPAAAPVLQQQPQKPQPPRNETLDLLSDLFAPTTSTGGALQPTVVPQPMQQQQQVQQQAPAAPQQQQPAVAAAPTPMQPDAATAAAAASSSSTIVRPAAAVMPMMQANVQQPEAAANAAQGDQMLSISGATSVGYAPSAAVAAAAAGAAGMNGAEKGQSLSSLLDPSSFSIGEGDAARLAKKQLHAAIKGAGPAPSLDPNDPLNQLDPFWKTK